MRLFYILLLCLFFVATPACVSTQSPQPVYDFPPIVEFCQPPFLERAAVAAVKYQQWFTLGAYILSIILVTWQTRKNSTDKSQQAQLMYNTKKNVGLFVRILRALIRRRK